jgi:metal-responsive CopG/Arc/MetJ family transcriptional regulator
MIRNIKTAISLPIETYQRAEALRRKTRKSRSELYTAALQVYFKAQEVRESEARYAAGYQAKPENMAEIRELGKAASALFQLEDW